MNEEDYIVQLRSVSISRADYQKIKNNKLTWEEWTKDNPTFIDAVLTEDGPDFWNL